jgi:hemolysin activation/secretion protein
VELRYDAGRVIKGLIDRAQLYGFVDGGMVDNLGQGIGGGSLASTGGGARLGTGRFDWLVEVAVPLNADRFDTGDRNPRLSLRLARAF